MQNKKCLRSERVSDVIHKELAIIIVKFCQDPRLDNLTITNVHVSPDLSMAKIYFTIFNKIIDLNNDLEAKNIKQILKILQNASKFLRSQLATRMSLRKIPELKFFYDDNVAYGTKIECLLAKVTYNPPKDHNDNND